MAKNEPKSFREFSMKDWKNFGIYLMVFGLFVMFVAKEYSLGGGLFLTGTIFTAIFQGPKIFKILKKKNW